jgi:hypothetical protein
MDMFIGLQSLSLILCLQNLGLGIDQKGHMERFCVSCLSCALLDWPNTLYVKGVREDVARVVELMKWI